MEFLGIGFAWFISYQNIKWLYAHSYAFEMIWRTNKSSEVGIFEFISSPLEAYLNDSLWIFMYRDYMLFNNITLCIGKTVQSWIGLAENLNKSNLWKSKFSVNTCSHSDNALTWLRVWTRICEQRLFIMYLRDE